MKQYMIIAVVSVLCMGSVQAMESQQSQQFSLTNNSDFDLTINVWQANLRRSGQKLIDGMSLKAGENCSFNVSAMAGKKCSLVVEINANLFNAERDWAYSSHGAYYLSGEKDGNNFFLSFTQGKMQQYLSPSKEVSVNNVKRIFSLPGNNWKYFELAMKHPGFDLDPAFSLTGQ